MPAYPYSICYRGQYNKDFNCITAVSMDAGFDQVSSFTAVEGVTSDLYNGIKVDHGSRYIEQVELTLTLIKKDYTSFEDFEKRQMLRWLSSSKYCSWLNLYDEYEEPIADVYGRFTSIEEKIVDSRVLGFVVTFTSPYPYFFSNMREIQQTFVGLEKITLENDTDELDALVRPYVVIKSKSAIPELTILNKTTNRKSVIKNIKMDETITIDNENKLIFSDNIYRIIGSDFCGVVDGDFVTSYPVWVELVPGHNELVIDAGETSSEIEYQMKYRYPIKLGSTF